MKAGIFGHGKRANGSERANDAKATMMTAIRNATMTWSRSDGGQRNGALIEAAHISSHICIRTMNRSADQIARDHLTSMLGCHPCARKAQSFQPRSALERQSSKTNPWLPRGKAYRGPWAANASLASGRNGLKDPARQRRHVDMGDAIRTERIDDGVHDSRKGTCATGLPTPFDPQRVALGRHRTAGK
jgi:hypothetical protein